MDAYTAGLFGDYSLLRGADRRALVRGSKRGPARGTLLVRPEEFRLGPADGEGVAGTVRAVRFQGSHYEVEVALPETVVRVRAAAAETAIGSAVSVSLAAEGGWTLSE